MQRCTFLAPWWFKPQHNNLFNIYIYIDWFLILGGLSSRAKSSKVQGAKVQESCTLVGSSPNIMFYSLDMYCLVSSIGGFQPSHLSHLSGAVFTDLRDVRGLRNVK